MGQAHRALGIALFPVMRIALVHGPIGGNGRVAALPQHDPDYRDHEGKRVALRLTYTVQFDRTECSEPPGCVEDGRGPHRQVPSTRGRIGSHRLHIVRTALAGPHDGRPKPADSKNPRHRRESFGPVVRSNILRLARNYCGCIARPTYQFAPKNISTCHFPLSTFVSLRFKTGTP